MRSRLLQTDRSGNPGKRPSGGPLPRGPTRSRPSSSMLLGHPDDGGLVMNRLLRRATSLLLAPVTVLAGALAAVALSAPPAAAGSPFGVQHLIVVLIEHPHNGCPIPA